MTAQELENMFRNVLAEGVTLDMLVYVFLIAALIVGSTVGSFLGAYAKRKGENFATKEDFSTLLEQVRKTTQETEAIKADIAKFNWVEQKRWDLKRDLYSKLLQALSALRRQTRLAETFSSQNEHHPFRDPGYYQEWKAKTVRVLETLDECIALGGLFLSSEANAALTELRKIWFEIGEGEPNAGGLGKMVTSSQSAYALILKAAKNDLKMGDMR